MSIVMEGGLLLAAWDYSLFSTIAGGVPLATERPDQDKA